VKSVLLSVFFLMVLSACSRNDEIFRESRIAMDTLCTITVVSHSRAQAKRAINSGFSRIAQLEKLLNYFSEKSEVGMINRSSGNVPVLVSKETIEIIDNAVKIAGDTGGAFDPTIGPLMKTWGFNLHTDEFSVPSEEDIKASIDLVDYKKIKVNNAGSEVFLEKEGMEIDLGGIAKGYAADKAVEAIREHGIRAALVTIAGDIKGYGKKPDGSTWKVGIQNPRPVDEKHVILPDDVIASLDLNDRAVSTSGDYQRFFKEKGIRYHHILDPKTGFPASGVMSVTVIAPDGYLADGLSTGVFILGREKGLRLLESLGLSGVVVDRNMEIFLTNDLKGEIKIEEVF
jgi:thiamine biosynthesis lipoprotein